jgi:hypothetical protein
MSGEGTLSKRSTWTIILCTMLPFAGIALYKIFIAPEGNSKVTLVRVIQTPKRRLMLGKETVGRGNRYSDGHRLTLVDPLTAQRVARKLLDDESERDYLGQIGGPLWLGYESKHAFSALDPETLEVKLTSEQLLKANPQLSSGIHDMRLDATRLAFRLTTNDGKSWRLDGASFALTELPQRTRQDDAADQDAERAREKAKVRAQSVEFEGSPRQALSLGGGKLGVDSFLVPNQLGWLPAKGAEPRTLLITHRDSLAKGATLQLAKVDPSDGRLLWSVSFPGQEKVLGWEVFDDSVAVVTTGEYHSMDDWLTSLSLSDGKLRGRYQF